MSVSPHPRDDAGRQKQADITSLQANPVTGTLAKAHLDQKLDQAQKELVLHYMNIGRLSAATILSTLS
jgi:hypothetical protein